MFPYKNTDALTLACQAWQMCPRTARGTMIIRLTPYYGRLIADVIDFIEEGDPTRKGNKK